MKEQSGVKRITVRMLEAHFNALPNLLNYVKRAAKNDPTANRTLKRFVKESKEERNILDPSEAVFGFAAMIATLEKQETFGQGIHPQRMAELAEVFCSANKLGHPAAGYGKRIANCTVPSVPEPSRIITLK